MNKQGFINPGSTWSQKGGVMFRIHGKKFLTRSVIRSVSCQLLGGVTHSRSARYQGCHVVVRCSAHPFVHLGLLVSRVPTRPRN